jgi:xanthine/uracil permease
MPQPLVGDDLMEGRRGEIGSRLMLPTALRTVGWILLLSYFVIAVYVAIALKDADAQKSVLIGAVIGTVVQGFLTFWVLVAAAEWLQTRPCLRCGKRVPAGETVCSACDFDFASVAP